MEQANDNEKVSERLPEYMKVPCDAIIANGGAVRKDGQSFVMFWKNRRNRNIALKHRLRYGEDAEVTVNLNTMSVVTDREMIIDELKDKSLAPLETIPRTKSKRKRKPKGIRYARR